jgi:sec-independent protein translocase protein TatA
MEILVVLIIALVVFGPKRLPELGKSLGKGISEFRGTISGDHTPEAAPAIEPTPVAVAPTSPVAETAPVGEPRV